MSHREEGIRVPGRGRAGVGKTGLLMALVVMLGASSAFANFTCEGKVTYLGMNPEGFVQMSVNGYGVWYMCSQTTNFVAHGGITFTPEGCRAWYATFLAAQKTGGTIRFWFQSSAVTNNGPECTALGTWQQPNPAPYHMHALD